MINTISSVPVVVCNVDDSDYIHIFIKRDIYDNNSYQVHDSSRYVPVFIDKLSMFDGLQSSLSLEGVVNYLAVMELSGSSYASTPYTVEGIFSENEYVITVDIIYHNDILSEISSFLYAAHMLGKNININVFHRLAKNNVTERIKK